jgi:hypothetical protein
MVAPLWRSTRTTPQFLSAVRQTDSKQKAWGVIRMWKPAPPLCSRRSSIVNQQPSCLSKTSSSWSLAISILRTFFHKTKEMQLLNLLILVSCQVWAKITMSGRSINCVLTCTALEARGPLNLTSHRELVFCATTSKRQKGCVVMSICPYIHTWIII